MIYTVFGIVDEFSGELMIAAVVEGKFNAVDTTGAGGRWADWFEADDPDHAEVLAYNAVQYNDA
jgi:hypothetical protein